jgi:hypothetical protein
MGASAERAKGVREKRGQKDRVRSEPILVVVEGVRWKQP